MNRAVVRRCVSVTAAALLLAGCIGSIPREEFDEELRSRGGGLDQSLLVDSIDAIASTIGTSEFQITNLYASPGSATATVSVRDPRNPDQLDRYTLRNGDILSVDPERLSANDDLDEDAFDIADIALDKMNEMVDTALAEYGADGGYVDGFAIRKGPTPGEIGERGTFIYLSLESDRSSANAVFSIDGELLTLELS